MPAIRGLTVATGSWYAATLAVCLVRNMRHLVECVVATSPEDQEVKAVVAGVPGARVFETDAFTRPDAHGVRPRLNKGLCIEECLDFMGRHGWLAIMDADILLPDMVPLANLRPDCLNGARRRVLEDVSNWHPGLDWSACPRWKDGGPIGFFQAFMAESEPIKDKRPWYDVSFAHCGGGDARFMSLWPAGKHNVMPMEVLHLGPTDLNWFGCDPAGRDMMARYIHENRWTRALPKHSAEAAARSPEVVRRVQMPGYDPSTYELPFERRAREARGGGKG